MEIKLKKLHFVNIRDYDDVEIEIESQTNVPHIMLIQMPNGTGKTTAHSLIQKMFSNDTPKPEEVKQYRPNPDTDSGFAEMIISIDNKTITITLEFDYLSNTATWYTTQSGLYGGKNEGFLIDQLNDFTTEFVKYFIFDGELAENFFKPHKDVAEQAINQLYGLRYLNNIANRSLSLGEKRLSDVKYTDAKTNIKTKQSLKAQTTTYTKLQKTLEILEKRKEECSHEINKTTDKLETVRKDISNLLSESQRDLLDSKIRDKAKLNIKLQELCSEFSNYSRSPRNFSKQLTKDITTLYDNMDRLKIPKTTSEEFFKELMKQDVCICGNHMTNEMRATIDRHSKLYMSDDIYILINGVKSSISEYDVDYDSVFNKYAEQYLELQSEIHKISMDISSIENDTKTTDKQAEFEKLNSVENELQLQLQGLNEELDILTSYDYEHDKRMSDCNIPSCNLQIKNLGNILKNVVPAVNFNEKSKLVSEMMNKIYEETMDSLKTNIIIRINSLLDQRFKGNLQIDSIKGHISIRGKNSNKGSASTGQLLTVAYMYITALFNSTLYSLPFVVDSPCGSLDKINRRFVAETIPDLFDHIIMLINPSERTDFADRFYNNDDARFLTIIKDEQNNNKISITEDINIFKSCQNEVEVKK